MTTPAQTTNETIDHDVLQRAVARLRTCWADCSKDPTPDDPRPGSLFHKYLPDGMEVTLYRMAYNFRVSFGETGALGGILDGYCYRDFETALRAAIAWDGVSPILDGWHRNPYTGMRRDDGDLLRERFAP